jgi:hypothetical protein
MPVLKPAAGRLDATCFGHISLSSCLCKTVEPTVGRRLFCVLESRNFLFGAQCGFRRHRSAVEHLVNLHCHVQNASLLLQRLVAVFFDPQNAYNTIWRCGVLRTLHRWNLSGSVPRFHSHFLQARFFLVLFGNVFSARSLKIKYCNDQC